VLWKGGRVLLNPSYGSDPIIRIDGPPAAIAEPAIRQRRRLAEALASLDEEQWAHPSRCDGWSSRDVIVHLDGTNAFWSYSIAAGLRGEPSQVLAAFDPAATPAEMVAAAADVPTSAVLDQFVASSEALVNLLASLDEADWTAQAEAPPGHQSVSAVAHHALWDSWIHERDILLPLGVTPDREPDEIAASLRYVAALGPAIAVNRGDGGTGRLAMAVTEPDLEIVVDVGDRITVSDGSDGTDPHLAGDAVELLEALSLRRPLDQPVPPDFEWIFGLLDAFANDS
jgi:uncharacterized protein (TIGR03083 family)